MIGLKKRLKKVIVTALIAGLTVNGVPVTAYGARVVSEPGPSCGVQVTPGTVSADDTAFEGVSDNASEAESNESVSDGASAGEEAGGTVSEDAAAKADEEASAGNGTGTEWVSSDSLPSGSGSYILSTDVTISSTWNVPNGENITLDLNGHTITMTENGDVIKVQDSSSRLTITDSSQGAGGITHSKGKTGRGVYVYVGYFTMEGGSIYGNKVNNPSMNGGGGVFVAQGGYLNMNGGSISGNTAKSGGGVFVAKEGDLTMNGGSISGNTAELGGGVFVYECVFTMNNGSINGNKASTSGGGVYVDYHGVFNMDGGSISGNFAQSGGGVYLINNIRDFTLKAGSISGNTATNNGGGVYINQNGRLKMEGGSIYKNTANSNGGGVYITGVGAAFSLSGTPEISGNTLTDTASANNVYLDGEKYIQIAGALNGTGKVGITCAEIPCTAVRPVEGYTITETDREYFFCDDPACYVDFDSEKTGLRLDRYIMPEDITVGDLVYNGQDQSITVSVNGETWEDSDDHTVTISPNKVHNVGDYTATITSNRIPGGKAEKPFKVLKAVYSGSKEASGTAVYGTEGMLELKDYIAEGGPATLKSVSDPYRVISGNVVFEDTLLKWSFKEDTGAQSKKATVLISVNNANYEDYVITAVLNAVPPCLHSRTEIRDVRKGTCSANGYSGDRYCLDCGAMLEKGEDTPKDPNNHYFDLNDETLKTVTRKPTVLQKGVHTYTCAWCKKGTMELEDIPCLPDEKDRELDELREDVADLSGNAAPTLEEKKDEKGKVVEETVTIGEKEVSKIITDPESGKETMETKLWVGGLKASYTYTGSKIEPEIHVYDGLTCLKKGTDYSLSYKNNKDAGTAGITVKFKGNYKGNEDQTLSFKIDPAVLGRDILAHDAGIYYTKKIQNPVPVLTWADTGNTAAGKDFRVDYDRNVKEPGTYKAVITSKNSNYTGEATANITVTDDKNKLLSKAKVQFDKKSYTYTGESIVPAATLKLGGAEVPADAYVMTCRNNVLQGTATASFEAVSGNAGGFVGTKTATFKISGKRELKEAGPDSDFTYDHSRKVPYAKGGAKPMVTVMDGNAKLSPGTDYTLSYQKNKAVTNGEESACVTVKGKGKYKGSVKLYFAIEPQSLNVLSAKITAADQFTTKKKLKKPSITITDPDGKKLKENTDYTVDPLRDEQGSEDAGSVTVKVTGKGAYKDTVPVTFRYFATASSNLAKAKQEKKIADQPFTGNPVALSANDLSGILQSGGKALVYGADFKVVDYINNTKKGTAKVKLHGINSLAGTKTLTFKITGKKAGYQGALIGGEWK